MAAILIGTLLVFGAVGLYLYATYAGARFIAKKTGNRAIALLAVLVLLVIPVSDEVIGRIQFNRLCDTEAGYVVSKVVETDGYFDGKNAAGCDISCKDALVKRGFRYIEINVREPGLPLREAGAYRFFLAKGDSPMCTEQNWYVSHYRDGFRGPVAMANDKCLVSVKISSASAQYEYVLAERKAVVPSLVRIERVSSYVKDRITGQLAAKSTSFVLFGGGWLVNNLSWHISGRSCPNDWKDSHGPVEAALQPRGT